MNQSDVKLVVSIHQNSFTGESSKGAQVFYQSTSEEGKKFAGIMQKKIASCINDGNHRIEKANSDYYILKNSSPVAIIVECGNFCLIRRRQHFCLMINIRKKCHQR